MNQTECICNCTANLNSFALAPDQAFGAIAVTIIVIISAVVVSYGFYWIGARMENKK